MTTNRTELCRDLSNRDFIERFAAPGRVGLVGGETLINRAIQTAERFVDDTQRPGLWSHAVLFEGRRADGQHWVIESDLEIHRRHIRLGVQENRAEKLHDEKAYSRIAILDFGLTDEQVQGLLREGLDMVARRYRYSLRELVGTLVALRKPGTRADENPLAREQSCYCSAFVQHLFRSIGMDLAPGLHEKHTTPEDISRTPIPHATWLLKRDTAPSDLKRALRRGLKQYARKKAVVTRLLKQPRTGKILNH